MEGKTEKVTAKLLYSPMRLIKLIQSRQLFKENLTKPETKCYPTDAKWYFTKEGEEAYRNADTPAKKIRYFTEYLRAADCVIYDACPKTAYIMASFVEGSSLDFANYPNILDPKKNPLLNVDFDKDSIVRNEWEYGMAMLAKLHGKQDYNEYLKYANTPYKYLTPLEKDGSMSDRYRLERGIIGIFCTRSGDKDWPPFLYDVTMAFHDSIMRALNDLKNETDNEIEQ